MFPDDGIGHYKFVGVRKTDAVKPHAADGGSNVVSMTNIESAGDEQLVRAAIPVDRVKSETAPALVDDIPTPGLQRQGIRSNAALRGGRRERHLAEQSGFTIRHPRYPNARLGTPEVLQKCSQYKEKQATDEQEHLKMFVPDGGSLALIDENLAKYREPTQYYS